MTTIGKLRPVAVCRRAQQRNRLRARAMIAVAMTERMLHATRTVLDHMIIGRRLP